MNKSILLILALCAFTVSEGRRGGKGVGEGRAGMSKQRGEFPMDPKFCFPLLMRNRRCCAMPSLIDETAKDACEALYRPAGAGSSSQEHGGQSGDGDDQGAAPQRQRATDQRASINTKGGSRSGRAAEGKGRRRGPSERTQGQGGEQREGRGHRDGMKGKIAAKICTMDCYFSNSSFYNTNGDIDGAKVLAAFLARPGVSPNWTAVVTTAVNDCLTNFTALSPKPTPPPGLNITCKTDATLYMGCIKRYLALNCVSPITSPGGNSCDLTGLQNCDPYYLPSGPPPGMMRGSAAIGGKAAMMRGGSGGGGGGGNGVKRRNNNKTQQ